jgi:phosphate-selective porin
MTLKGWWIRSIVLGSAILLAPIGAWADKLTDLEQTLKVQQQSLQRLRQEMQQLRQERSVQQDEMARRVMEVEQKAAEAAASAYQVGFEPGKGFSLQSSDGQFKLNLRGFIQNWFIVEGARDEDNYPGTVDGQDVTKAGLARHNPSTFRIRRTRLVVSGQVFNDFGFLIEQEITGGSTGTRLEEAYVNYAYAPWAKLTVGQYKARFGLEMLTSSRDLDFAERTVTSRALSPEYQLGLTLEGNLKLAAIPVYYGVGLYNGCGRVDQCSGGIDNDGNKEYTGRVTFAPPIPVGNLTIGLNVDHRTFRVVRGKGATDPSGVTTPVGGGSTNHRFNPISPTGVRLAGNGEGGTQNGFLINGNRIAGGGDIVFDLYPFILKGEYIYATQERDDVGAGGSNLDNLIMQGGYGSIGYWLFGNKQRGLLANGRYEHMRVDDNKGTFTAPDSAKHEVPMELRSGTFGLSWYLNPNVRLRGNYILTDLRPGRNAVGLSNSAHGEIAHEGIAELLVQF